MTIENHENEKLLWCRRNNPGQGLIIRLHTGPDKDSVRFIQSDSVSPIVFDEEQFLEMIQAGAAHFGKKLTITDLPTPCPNCGGTIFEYISGLEATVRQKRCERCGLTGPTAVGREGADEAWDVFFHQTKPSTNLYSPISISEELDRR